MCVCSVIAAATYAAPPRSEWGAATPIPQAVKLDSRFAKDDSGAEFTRFRFVSTADFQTVRLLRPHEPALAMDEFKVSVPLVSAHKGIRLALELVLPKQIDPRTGAPLMSWVVGEESADSDDWQTLSVAGDRAAVQAQVRQLRSELSQSNIDSTGAYFDSCALVVELHHGTTFLDVGDPQYGPVVKPDVIVPRKSSEPEQSRSSSRVRIERDRLIKNDKAVFLRILPDHNESPELLQQLGVNAVWVADLTSTQRMQSLAKHGILVLATPPHPEFDPADFSQPLQGLPPLDARHPLPDIWMFGTRISVDQFPHLLAWAREVRSADKNLRRPLMADVLSAEGVAARKIGLVGISQHSTGSLRNFGEARNRSFLRQNATAQLSLPWEWLQTEAASGFAEWRQRSGATPVFVEPEQVMMQLIAALSAGSRGIGFWKTRTLGDGSPEQRESAAVIELANLYLDILDPLLLDGRLDNHIPISLSSSDASSRKSGLVSAPSFSADRYSGIPEGPDAAIGSTRGPSLVLAGYWDNNSHYVPQALFARKATLTVAATETASAWQVFATGLRGLRREPAAGGLRLSIQDFDQHAAILVASDSDRKRQLEARIQTHAERAGQLFVDLAELKLARVMKTCAIIDAEASAPDLLASQSFQNARQMVSGASEALGRRDFPSAERMARSSMREVRAVQNRYWQRAIQMLPTPMASPHTVSFSTLADHWKMMNEIRSTAPSENLVPSGSFSSLRLLSDGAWKKIAPQDNLYFSSADIVTENAGSNQVLQLQAWRRNSDAVSVSGKPSLMVRSPELEAFAGDVFEINLKVKMGQRIRAESESPLLVFDDDLGPEFAVRPILEPSWRTIRMYRQISQDGPFRVWIALGGVGEVFVDDITVIKRAGRLESGLPNEPKTSGSPILPVSNTSRVQGAGYSNSSLP